MLSSPSPSPTLLIEQLRCLEAQIPVRILASNANYIVLTWNQPPGTTVPSSSTEHVVTVNQILTNARSLRDTVAVESTEANKKLSEAVLDVMLYRERVECANRLLALADSCVGQIRARMRAHGIPIHPPSETLDSTTPSDSVGGPVTSGKSVFLERSWTIVLTR